MAELVTCSQLIKERKTLKKMLDERKANGLAQTAQVKAGKVEEVHESKGAYTNHPKGIGIVYTGDPANPTSQPQVRDVYELASKDRPFVCRINRAFGSQDTLDCWSLDQGLGKIVTNNLQNTKSDMRDLIKEARERTGTSDRTQWTHWERGMFREIMDRRGRMKYVIGASTDSAGHKFPFGTLIHMMVNDCHQLLK